jgi:hypothetical protein
MNTNLLTFAGQDAMAEAAPPTRGTTPLLAEEKDQKDWSEEGITARASAITTVLDDILTKAQAFPHGGINE